MRKFLIALMAVFILCSFTGAFRSVTADPEIQIPPVIVIPTPEPIPEPIPLWTEEEVTVLAQMLWGEARGVESTTEQAACVWCVLNRVDAYGKSIVEVTTAPYQFLGYQPDNPVDPDLKALCEDVLTRYFAEKDGDTNAGRIIPADYLFFYGDGERNHFRNDFKSDLVWDWSLPSPYES